jgi:hypothetical protein
MKTGKHRITLKRQSQFVAELKDAVVEKDVESAYKAIFQEYYGTTFPSPYGSDGYIEEKQSSLLGENDKLSLLLEVKFRLNLTRKQDRARIVAQTIYYLKKFQQDGINLPTVIVGGDENEIFTVYAPKLYEYLDKPYDWSIAPSSVWEKNEELIRELNDDPNLNVFVFDVRSPAFDINEIFRSIGTLTHHNADFKKLRVTEANIRKVFDEFLRVVFGENNWLPGVKKIGAQETVSIFIRSILGDPDIYIVPTKKNMLHVGGDKDIQINASNYDAFFSRYDRKYTTNEIDEITAVADQLIEEMKRRFHGDFWTPTIWADRAIQMITDDLGADWRDKFVVWDCAAGTKNLTRDYSFKRLYSSTIHQSEIDMSKQYNKDAKVFQYDFLNDDIDINPDTDPRTLTKMPESLFLALKNNEPIIFYTNPPYGQATNAGADGTHKAGIADTKIGSEMRRIKFAHGTVELYTQFIYRVQKLAKDFNLTNVFFFFFFNKGFLVSPAFEKFTDQMLDQFKFNGGFMLNAGEFEGTSSAWGIVFSNFEIKKDNSPRQSEFTFSVEKSDFEGIAKIQNHTMHRVKGKETISSWLRDIKLPKEQYNFGKYPQMSSAFGASKGTKPRGRLCAGSIGYMVNNADSIQESQRTVSIHSTSAYRANGTPVIAENFERACVTFAVRKSILPDASWINDKDTFRRPSDNFQISSEWPFFVTDCVVYSLFHRSSYQTSLRNFAYLEELYDVYNEWFFMAKDEVIKLAEKNALNDVVYDARSSNERFVYKYLSDKKLSPEASEVLKKGQELIRKTFAKRFLADQDRPDWHLMTWDAGFYQAYKITTMFKAEFADFMTEFTLTYQKLETKIRNKVYEDKILEK